MLNAERSAMPVMMPGSAIGRTKSSEMDSRPKNRARASAARGTGPKQQRQHVATAATLSDKVSAARCLAAPRRWRTIVW